MSKDERKVFEVTLHLTGTASEVRAWLDMILAVTAGSLDVTGGITDEEKIPDGQKGSDFSNKKTAKVNEVLTYGKSKGCEVQNRGNHRGLYNPNNGEFLAVGNHPGDLSPGVFSTIRKVFGRWGILLFPLLCIGSFWLLLYVAAP